MCDLLLTVHERPKTTFSCIYGGSIDIILKCSNPACSFK